MNADAIELPMVAAKMLLYIPFDKIPNNAGSVMPSNPDTAEDKMIDFSSFDLTLKLDRDAVAPVIAIFAMNIIGINISYP